MNKKSALTVQASPISPAPTRWVVTWSAVVDGKEADFC